MNVIRWLVSTGNSPGTWDDCAARIRIRALQAYAADDSLRTFQGGDGLFDDDWDSCRAVLEHLKATRACKKTWWGWGGYRDRDVAEWTAIVDAWETENVGLCDTAHRLAHLTDAAVPWLRKKRDDLSLNIAGLERIRDCARSEMEAAQAAVDAEAPAQEACTVAHQKICVALKEALASQAVEYYTTRVKKTPVEPFQDTLREGGEPWSNRECCAVLRQTEEVAAFFSQSIRWNGSDDSSKFGKKYLVDMKAAVDVLNSQIRSYLAAEARLEATQRRARAADKVIASLKEREGTVVKMLATVAADLERTLSILDACRQWSKRASLKVSQALQALGAPETALV